MNISTSPADFAKAFDYDFDACKAAAKVFGLGWYDNHTHYIAVSALCVEMETLRAIEAGETVWLKTVVDFDDGNSARKVSLHASLNGFFFVEDGSYYSGTTKATEKQAAELITQKAKDWANAENKDLAKITLDIYLAVEF